MKSGKKLDLSLYLVLDANLCKTPEGMAETARKAVEGGCTVVQLRAPEWKKKKQLRAAFLLKELLKDTDVLFIVDDHIDIAWRSGCFVSYSSSSNGQSVSLEGDMYAGGVCRVIQKAFQSGPRILLHLRLPHHG